MDFLQKMDNVLDYLDNENDRFERIDIIQSKLEFQYTKKELELILNKLYKDGYIDEKTFNAFDKIFITQYRINYDGKMFNLLDGYSAQYKTNRMTNTRASVSEICIILGGIGASIAGFYSLWKIFQVVYSAFSSS